MKTTFNFNTIGLFSRDNKSMVAFYRDVMGFTTDWNGEDPDVRMQLGNMWLLMFPRTAFEQMTSRQYSYPQGLNGTVELAFHVPTFKDVDKEYTKAIALGAKPIFVPQTMPWGQRTSYIADPEDNLIEIHSFTKN